MIVMELVANVTQFFGIHRPLYHEVVNTLINSPEMQVLLGYDIKVVSRFVHPEEIKVRGELKTISYCFYLLGSEMGARVDVTLNNIHELWIVSKIIVLAQDGTVLDIDTNALPSHSPLYYDDLLSLPTASGEPVGISIAEQEVNKPKVTPKVQAEQAEGQEEEEEQIHQEEEEEEGQEEEGES